MMGVARSKLIALAGATALSLLSASAQAAGLIGATANIGFYLSGDAFGPPYDPGMIYPIDQSYSNVTIADGASYFFSDKDVANGVNDPYGKVTFTSTGITFTNLVGDPFPTSAFAGFVLQVISGPDVTSLTKGPVVDSNFGPYAVGSFTPRQIRVNFSGGCLGNPADPKSFTCHRPDANGVTNEVVSFAVATAAATPGVPEPATWTLMIAGFGAVGAALRRRRASVRFA